MSVSVSRGLGEVYEAVFAEKEAADEFLAGDLSLSYGELASRVHRTMRLFAAEGLSPTDRIVVASSDDVETSVLYLAALRYGLCTAVIDPFSSVPEAILLVSAVDPKAIFMDAKLARDAVEASPDTTAKLFVLGESKPASQPGVPNFVTLKKKRSGPGRGLAEARDALPDTAPETTAVAEDATALVLFTSGTTSRPKGVELTFGNLRAQFETFVRQYGFGATSRILNHLPLHHTDGLNQGPAIALFCGGCWVRPTSSVAQNLDGLLGMVRAAKATHIITVPTVLALIDQLPASYDDSFAVEGFAFLGSTAGYLDETLWRRFEQRFGVMVVNSYGLTETVSEALYCGPDEATRRMGSVGRPVDCEARIVDADGNDVPVSTTGELVLRGTNVLKGYLNDPEATDAVLIDGWFHTGDLAQRDDDGFYFIVGRKKNLIIRAGINVYPDDVTNAIMELDEVLEAATIGVEDSVLGQKVVSCVTPSGTAEELVERVAAHCKERLAPERRPDHVLVLESLPRGPSGKVILNELRETVHERLQGPAVASEGSLQDQILAVAASVFAAPADSLSPQTSSESLEAWDSLAHLALVSALEKQFEITFAAEDIMNLSTLGKAVAIVESKTAD